MIRVSGDPERLAEAEAILLDCDGTLIDASRSYNLSIRLTTIILLDRLAGLKISLGPELEDVLKAVRMTGGFNNDWDTTSALIQTIYAWSPERREQLSEDVERVDVEEFMERAEAEATSPGFVAKSLEWLGETMRGFGGFADLRAVERLIDSEALRLGSLPGVRLLRLTLGYPGGFGESLLATIFDEIFLGAEGVREKYGVEPRYAVSEGTLKNERLLVSEETVRRLSDLTQRGLALVTGRGRWETERTMKPLLRYLNLDASIYTADLGPEYEKPSPKPLIESARLLGAESIIYVGNSMEDLLTAQAASKEGIDAAFVAVASEEDVAQQFISRGADAVLRDVNLLPDLIELSRRSPETLI